MAAKVDKSKCAGCESCVGACPVNAISMKDGVAEVTEADCVGCGAALADAPAKRSRLCNSSCRF